MKKDEPMSKDGMSKDGMMKSDMPCRTGKTDGKKKDDAMMKKDATCADMVKKDGMKKDNPMKKSIDVRSSMRSWTKLVVRPRSDGRSLLP